jgi:hypothetical protein
MLWLRSLLAFGKPLSLSAVANPSMTTAKCKRTKINLSLGGFDV